MKPAISWLLLFAFTSIGLGQAEASPAATRRVTTILVKQDGRWLTAGRQSTPIFQPK